MKAQRKEVLKYKDAILRTFRSTDNAGLRRGDIIEEINGNKIENPSQISSYIRKKKMVSDTVTVVINRYGRVYEVPLQLEARP